MISMFANCNLNENELFLEGEVMHLRRVFIFSSFLKNVGSPDWTRTSDIRINSPPFYQLNYRGIDLSFTFTILNWLPGLDSNQ